MVATVVTCIANRSLSDPIDWRIVCPQSRKPFNWTVILCVSLLASYLAACCVGCPSASH